MKLNQWGVIVALAAVLYGAAATIQGARYNKEASVAEAYNRAAADTIDSLEAKARASVVMATRAETLFIRDTASIARADAISHPDSTCNQSIAARDSALVAAEQEDSSWKLVVDMDQQALRVAHDAEDSLADVLAHRPKLTMPALEALHPSIHLSLQALVYPKPQVGIGLSYDVARIKL